MYTSTVTRHPLISTIASEPAKLQLWDFPYKVNDFIAYLKLLLQIFSAFFANIFCLFLYRKIITIMLEFIWSISDSITELILLMFFNMQMDCRNIESPSNRWSVTADVESLAWDPHNEHSFVVSFELHCHGFTLSLCNGLILQAWVLYCYGFR